jgi:hypothetical protein
MIVGCGNGLVGMGTMLRTRNFVGIKKKKLCSMTEVLVFRSDVVSELFL